MISPHPLATSSRIVCGDRSTQRPPRHWLFHQSPLIGSGPLIRSRSSSRNRLSRFSICNGFLNDEALATLELLIGSNNVEVLFRQDQTSPAMLSAFKKQSKKQNRSFASRQSPGLHDRYVLSGDKLILLGAGLSGIGSGDSYIIELNKEIARGLIRACWDTFDDHWAKGKSL